MEAVIKTWWTFPWLRNIYFACVIRVYGHGQGEEKRRKKERKKQPQIIASSASTNKHRPHNLPLSWIRFFDFPNKVGVILEAHASIRNKLKQYALDLAEKLDETIAKQAEEKAAYQSHVQEKLIYAERNVRSMSKFWTIWWSPKLQ